MIMNFDKTYSLADIARVLGRPPTTVSSWRAQYEEFLPTVGNGKSRRYTQGALEMFTMIAEMKDDNQPHEVILQTLRQNADEIIVHEYRETPSLLQKLMMSYSNILEVVKEQRDLLEAQQETIQELRGQLDQISHRMNEKDEKDEERDKRANERDKALMDIMKQLQETAIANSKKSWLDRLLGR